MGGPFARGEDTADPPSAVSAPIEVPSIFRAPVHAVVRAPAACPEEGLCAGTFPMSQQTTRTGDVAAQPR